MTHAQPGSDGALPAGTKESERGLIYTGRSAHSRNAGQRGGLSDRSQHSSCVPRTRRSMPSSQSIAKRADSSNTGRRSSRRQSGRGTPNVDRLPRLVSDRGQE
jgi:hypothetical protein